MKCRSRNDVGSSLIELLVATIVMGTAVIVLITGFTAMTNSSSQNRQATTAAVVARDYAEALELAVSQTGVWCSASYTVSYTPPSGYSVTPVVGACPANNATTPQFQTVAITATAPGGDAEHLTIVVREP